MKKIITILVLFFTLNAFAQKDVYLTITHKLGTMPFAFNQAASNDLGNNLSITRIDYYLSKFTIIHDGGQLTKVDSGTYILAKGNSNVVVKIGNYNVTQIEGIKFHVGVDAPTNNADPNQWVAPHPLAPQSPSMHWGWTPGYRFVALQGFTGAALDIAFEIHGLFNANYFSQTLMVTGMESNNNLYINMNADYLQALKGVDVSSGPIDHGANATDLKVLQNFRDFVFSPGSSIPTIGLSKSFINYGISVFPNPSSGKFQILKQSNLDEITEANIYDVCGKLIQEIKIDENPNIDFEILNKGLYIIQLSVQGIPVASQKLIVQ